MSKSFDRTSKVAHRRIQRQMAQNTERINRLLKKYAKIGHGFTDRSELRLENGHKYNLESMKRNTSLRLG